MPDNRDFKAELVRLEVKNRMAYPIVVIVSAMISYACISLVNNKVYPLPVDSALCAFAILWVALGWPAIREIKREYAAELKEILDAQASAANTLNLIETERKRQEDAVHNAWYDEVVAYQQFIIGLNALVPDDNSTTDERARRDAQIRINLRKLETCLLTAPPGVKTKREINFIKRTQKQLGPAWIN